ncbi:MAG: hypothetical protein ABJY83_06370 [Roseibium sp.]
MISKTAKLGSFAIFATMLAYPATAADLNNSAPPAVEPVEEISPWEFELGVYAFVPVSVEGTSVVDGGSVNLDLDLGDVVDLLEFAASGRAEAWRKLDVANGSAFGFVFDAQYVNLGLKKQNIGPASGGTVKVDIRQGIIDTMVGYRLPSVSMGADSNQRIDFDVTAGARYNYLRQRIDVTPGLVAPFTRNLGDDKHWVSPVIGARANFVFNDRWNLVVRGDMSGFGVSGENLSWALNGLAGYKFTENATFRFGYRVYDIDYSSGTGSNEFAYDVTEHGPILGLSYKF